MIAFVGTHIFLPRYYIMMSVAFILQELAGGSGWVGSCKKKVCTISFLEHVDRTALAGILYIVLGEILLCKASNLYTVCSLNIEFFFQEFSIFNNLFFASTGLLLVVQK